MSIASNGIGQAGGYYNNEGGELDMWVARSNPYWRGPMTFIKILDRWLRDGSMPRLELAR